MKKKYDILIFSSLPKNSGCYLRAKYFSDALLKNNVSVKFIIPPFSMPFMLDFMLSLFTNTFYVFKYNFKYGFAIKPYPNTLIPLLLKKIFTNIKIGVDIDDVDFGYREGLITKISKLLQKPFPKYFDFITFHNDNLIDYIQNEFKVQKDKLYPLLQGVDFSIFNKKNRKNGLKESIIKKFKLTGNTKIIVYSAHLNIASDLDIILNNINNILSRRNYFFIVAGGGPMLKYFKHLAEKNHIQKIMFTDYLAPAEIVHYLLIADVLIAYYKDKEVNYYRSYMKIREYLALQKRVVCNSVGELKLFKKYTYQTKNDINEFLKKIDYLLKTNYSDGREKKAAKFIKQHYNWNSIAAEFKKTFLGKKGDGAKLY